jgi:diadenosine tetraphosphatase ApaH/serine/threonine PP2A family protein phosphatase
LYRYLAHALVASYLNQVETTPVIDYLDTTMPTLKQETVKRLKMSERAQQQLELHFPSFDPRWLWQRKANAGFTTVPRTLPLAMQAIDAQTKGQPAGHTLFCLWSRSPDHPLVTIENPATFASEAGFYGERAVDTWRRRMKQLHALNFIVPKSGPSGDFHYVLLLNPNVAMEYMYRRMQSSLYARFIDRLNDVGAHRDVDEIRAYWAGLHAAAVPAANVPSAPVGADASPEVSTGMLPTAPAVSVPPPAPANDGK